MPEQPRGTALNGVLERSNVIRSYLQLVRAPAAFSAASNIIAAQFVASGGAPDWRMAGLLLVISAGLYSAGMAMNDCYDHAIDNVERPDRPIPSGRVTLEKAWLLVAVLVAIAMIAGAVAGPRQLLVAVILLSAIWLYNAKAKGRTWGPVVMGLCRYLNWVLGLSTVAKWSATWFAVALPVFVYIWSITSLGRDEMAAENRANLYILWFGILVSIALIFANSRAGGNALGLFVLMALLWLLPILAVILRLWGEYSPEKIRRTMRLLILAIIPLDTLILTSFGYWAQAAVVLSLLLPSWYLARKIYVT